MSLPDPGHTADRLTEVHGAPFQLGNWDFLLQVRQASVRAREFLQRFSALGKHRTESHANS